MLGKILIVEDDQDIRRNLKKLLEREDYSVETAENGQVALDILDSATELPKLIILDLSMPIMDGFEFREIQRKHPKISDIPVIVMTADGHIQEKSVRTAADLALRKPADIESILRAVGKFLPRN